ncbi:DHH family phosphoesterase [Patescibacteria group bacterium]|nr:DHH family phosphoesterase [Patescibacteria group bacterium]
MERKRLHQEIYDNFVKAKNILIVIHQNPDGDAIGSGLSLASYFKGKDWPHTIFSLDAPSKQFDFLPDIEVINSKQDVFVYTDFDLVAILDSGDLRYAGVEELINKIPGSRPLLINIDHHHTNQLFGDLNLVDPAASSTAEILFNFFDDLRIDINQNMATNLLTGILMDTGTFSNPATTIDSLSSSAKLLIQGGKLPQIISHAVKNKELATLKLWGKALSRLKKNNKTGFVTTAITQKDMEECQTNEEATEGVSNFLNNLSDTKAVIVFRELGDGMIKGSLRTTDDLIDVSEIATMFGGGGHKKAAGFTVKGKLEETVDGWQVKQTP